MLENFNKIFSKRFCIDDNCFNGKGETFNFRVNGKRHFRPNLTKFTRDGCRQANKNPYMDIIGF